MEIICAGSLTVLELGKRGSNQTRAIRFDIAEWMADYPDGSVHILHKRPGEETPLPVSNTEKTDTYIDWVIEQADVANEGYGECELVMMDTISHTAKSVTYMTHIGTPISSSDETVPEPHQGWVDSVLQAATDAEAAKNAAVDAQTAAETAQSAAEAAQTAAEKAQDTAENAKASAVMSSNAAYNYAADANRARRDSVNAKNDAVQAKTDAENAQEAAENAEESANTSALKSEGYAVGTQNGTPAGSGEPYYQDNAKYYKEQAAAAKTAAETARDTAQQTVAGIEAAGTAQVGRVAAEGATQVTNVQTKGQQVLDSIPSDYSQLSGNVDELKSAFDNTNKYLFPDYYPQAWVSGYYINANTGAQASASSWSFSNYFNVIPGSKLRIVNFAKTVASPVGVAFYDAQAAGAYISGSGFVYDSAEYAEITVPSNAKYCRISVLTNKLTDYGFSQEIEPWINEIEQKTNTAFDKSAIAVKGKNLFDKSAVIRERYLNASGNPTFNTNYCVSDFIPITEGKTYQISFEWNAWVYDANKTGLRNVSIHNIFTAQSGDAFLRITVANANVDVAQVEESLFQSKYQSYGYKIKKSDLDFDDVSALPDNMFNPNDMTRGFMNGTTGAVSSSTADYWVTDYLGVKVGKIYTVSGMWGSVCIYHADGTFSRMVEGVGEEFRVTTFQPVDDESYARFTVKGSNKTKCKFEENIGYSKYTGAVSGVVNIDSIVGETEKTTHVYVGSPCFFKTINAANNAISGNSKYNRFVIHIFEGTYNETFRTKDWVDYVGDNKHQCIIDYISDDESDYVNRSTIFAETNSKIANLTIKTTGSKYPIHADANYGLPYVVTIEDCIIKHDGYADTSIAPGGTGIGIGLHYDQHVVIRRCVIAGTSNVFGVASVYCHNDNQNQNNWWARRERSLTIEDCILQDSYYGVRLDAIETVDGQDNDFIYIGNVNTCQRPFLYNQGSFDSWHYFGLMNEPEYTPSN